MKIGLYFGSFNPVHIGHLIIASHAVNETDLNQVWFVVSPQNPFKQSASLLNEYHRLHLIKAAIDGENNLRASNVEFNLPKPSYTIHTLAYLHEKFPQHEFALIMGSDNLTTFHKWKNYELILANHDIYVYPRPLDDGGELKNHERVKIISAPLMEVSSSFIRKSIKENKDVRYMMPESVHHYIEEMHFYEK